jgi:hypothetical protein
LVVSFLDWVNGLGDLAGLIPDRAGKRDDDRPAKRRATLKPGTNTEPRVKHRLLHRPTRGLKQDD